MAPSQSLTTRVGASGNATFTSTAVTGKAMVLYAEGNPAGYVMDGNITFSPSALPAAQIFFSGTYALVAFTQLPNGGTYYFTVAASVVQGSGPYSNLQGAVGATGMATFDQTAGTGSGAITFSVCGFV
jgi:hypothetical protein